MAMTPLEKRMLKEAAIREYRLKHPRHNRRSRRAYQGGQEEAA